MQAGTNKPLFIDATSTAPIVRHIPSYHEWVGLFRGFAIEDVSLGVFTLELNQFRCKPKSAQKCISSVEYISQKHTLPIAPTYDAPGRDDRCAVLAR